MRRLLTYNVHDFVGLDARRDPARVIGVIERARADVVALQELDTSRPGPDGEPLLEALERALGMRVIFAPTLRRGEGAYGHALLTRGQPLEPRIVRLAGGGREPRRAIGVRLSLDAGSAWLVSTHLGLRAGVRRRQLRRVLELFDEGARDADEAYLMGDFNVWSPLSVNHLRLRRRFGAVAWRGTYPAWRPMLALDRIYASDGTRILRRRVLGGPTARIASDHLPLLAELS